VAILACPSLSLLPKRTSGRGRTPKIINMHLLSLYLCVQSIFRTARTCNVEDDIIGHYLPRKQDKFQIFAVPQSGFSDLEREAESQRELSPSKLVGAK
jgi:hypothetical protein